MHREGECWSKDGNNLSDSKELRQDCKDCNEEIVRRGDPLAQAAVTSLGWKDISLSVTTMIIHFLTQGSIVSLYQLDLPWGKNHS